MAVPTKPGKHTALKKDAWWLIPACADVTAPTVAEINAATGIYATCFLRADFEGVTRTTNKVQTDALMCEDVQYEALAPTAITMSDLVGVVDPQAADTDDDKLLYEFLRNGYTGFAVQRQNVTNDTSDAAVAGEFVNVVPVDISAPGSPYKSAAGPEGIYQFMCAVAVTGACGDNVEVQA